MFYIHVFDVILSEDDLKKNETCRSISGFFNESANINTCAFAATAF